MKKSTADAIINAFGKLKEQRDKSDAEAKTGKGKQDKLSKALQKELKEYR